MTTNRWNRSRWPRDRRVITMLALASLLPACALAQDALDDEMRSMDQRHTELHSPPIQRALTTVRTQIGRAVGMAYNAVMQGLSVPDLAEMDQAVLDDPDEYSMNTVAWAQARQDVRAVEDALANFPFPHFYSWPGVEGDYMQNGLGPMIDEVQRCDSCDE